MAMVLAGLQGVKFGTGTDNASGLNTELMRLTSAGNVGIGTDQPNAKLDVNGFVRVTDLVVGGGAAIGTTLSVTDILTVRHSGTRSNDTAIRGHSVGGAGVRAESDNGTGIIAQGVQAGQFNGDVLITGGLTVSGNKNFKIDHPLDAAKKYLYHASVESPEMKNIYDGVVVLDAQGEAEVTLPAWFDALNADLRYQLTAIGAAGPDLYIAEEMSANRFKIAGGKPHMKVCWQVTGIRQDAWAKANPLPVEQDKPAQEQGYYLHPELYGESEQKSIAWVRYPEMVR